MKNHDEYYEADEHARWRVSAFLRSHRINEDDVEELASAIVEQARRDVPGLETSARLKRAMEIAADRARIAAATDCVRPLAGMPPLAMTHMAPPSPSSVTPRDSGSRSVSRLASRVAAGCAAIVAPFRPARSTAR